MTKKEEKYFFSLSFFTIILKSSFYFAVRYQIVNKVTKHMGLRFILQKKKIFFFLAFASASIIFVEAYGIGV